MIGLEDAFEKFYRGENQLNEFYKRIVGVLSEDRVKFEIKKQEYPKPPSDSRRNWMAYTLYSSSVPVIPKRDGIILGEIVQSFRSSLDYLAWSFVTKYNKFSLLEKEKRRIQFPMFSSHKQFIKGARKILPNIPHTQVSLFESYQPYKRSTIGRTIRYLQVLSNTDKHRIIVPTVLFPETSTGNINYQGGDLVKRMFHLKKGYEIKNGAKILTIVLAGNDAQQKVRIDSKLTLLPMFPRNLIRRSVPEPINLVEPVLNSIRDVCFDILTKSKKNF